MTAAVPLRVGFIGAGKMALALARGFIQAPIVGSSSQIMASCPVRDRHLLEDIASLGCQATHCNKTLVEQSDITILAVKPSVIPAVLDDIRDNANEHKIIVSIAAGIKIKNLEERLAPDCKVVRVMPNTPSLVGEGATVFSTGANCNGAEAEIVRSLFLAVGNECHEVGEHLIDAVTGISGSGPAYMYIIIEAMADAGVKRGLPRDIAYRLAAQTMVGAGQMVLKTNQHPAVLKDAVCSPSGSTIAALEQLERGGLRTAIWRAVDAATDRCAELGGK